MKNSDRSVVYSCHFNFTVLILAKQNESLCRKKTYLNFFLKLSCQANEPTPKILSSGISFSLMFLFFFSFFCPERFSTEISNLLRDILSQCHDEL